MDTSHIDETTLALYAAGYAGIREDLVIAVENHLRRCLTCASRLESVRASGAEAMKFPRAIDRARSPRERDSNQPDSQEQIDLVRIDEAPTRGEEPIGSLTQILNAIDDDESARNKFWDLVYGELLAMAQNQMTNESRSRFDAHDLVHEAYLRIFSDRSHEWGSRRHFFGTAARVMREILVDGARRRFRLRRGEASRAIPRLQIPLSVDSDPSDTLAVHEALEALEKVDQRKASVVQLRFFAGLTNSEAAEVLGVSIRTLDMDWNFAVAWLREYLERSTEPESAKRYHVLSIDSRVEQLFEYARRLSKKPRQDFLNEACGDDKELYQKLEALLRHDQEHLEP